ncbi:MAG TPA: ABC transporter permease [Dehalococcoidia bacterium]|nr:ABC transporter permease [Dehalococcoidia bacterium]
MVTRLSASTATGKRCTRVSVLTESIFARSTNQRCNISGSSTNRITMNITRPIVMALVGFSLVDQKPVLNWVAPGLRVVVVRFFTFLLTSVRFLRERAQGALERLMTTTVACDDILVGYLLGFLLFATIQTAVILAFTIYALQIDYQGAAF